MGPLQHTGRLVVFRSLRRAALDGARAASQSLKYTAGAGKVVLGGQLGDSMSDGFYTRDHRSDPREDLRLRAIRDLQVAPTRAGAHLEPLGNSLSDGAYESRRERPPRTSFHSLSDPSEYFLQNSLAGDSNYDLPTSLRTPYAPRPKGKGFGAHRSRATLQRIVVGTRSIAPGQLHDSYSAGEYQSRKDE